jgi:hypothetical protein
LCMWEPDNEDQKVRIKDAACGCWREEVGGWKPNKRFLPYTWSEALLKT